MERSTFMVDRRGLEADKMKTDTLRCFACGSTDFIYKLAKVFCARCHRLVENCCGD